MAEWSEDHVVAIGNSTLESCARCLDKLEIGRAPLVERKDRQLERSGSGVWKADTFKVVAPRLCWLRTDGLPPQTSIECTDRMLVI
jgi:hypothetical protein